MKPADGVVEGEKSSYTDTEHRYRHTCVYTGLMALVRLCILMTGSEAGTSIDFIANCIPPCCLLSGKRCFYGIRPVYTYLHTLCVSCIRCKRRHKYHSDVIYSDVLIRPVNSARKWIVHENNKSNASLRFIKAQPAFRVELVNRYSVLLNRSNFGRRFISRCFKSSFLSLV